jgi:hypothetical protein
MKTFIRDSTVSISVNFYDSTGVIVNPASATVTLSYMKAGRNSQPDHASYPLVQQGNDWNYSWDSRVADEGPVYGHAQTDGNTPVSSVDFEFRLIANEANRNVAQEC